MVAARLRQRIETTRRMMQDNLIPYAKGKADIRASDDRIRQIEQELAAAGRVVSLPPRRATEGALREITNGPEPRTYERRRSILEAIVDLRINYLEGNLEIEGKVPVPEFSLVASAGGQKNRYRRLGADANRQRYQRGGGESGTLTQAPEDLAERSHGSYYGEAGSRVRGIFIWRLFPLRI